MVPRKLPLPQFYLLLVLGLFSLMGCTTSEEPEYDVFVSKRIQNFIFKLDDNNRPVILAEVAWYFTTKKKNVWGTKDTISHNSEQVIFSRKNGTWSRHSFRNLNGGYGYTLSLLKNYYGELQPLIFDRLSITLFAFEGEKWQIKSKVQGGVYDNFMHAFGNGTNLLVGTEGWQNVVMDFGGTTNSLSKTKTKVLRSDKSSFILDSTRSLPILFKFATKSANFALGVMDPLVQTDNDSSQLDGNQKWDLVLYSWSHSLQFPKPKKQILRLSDFGEPGNWPNTYSPNNDYFNVETKSGEDKLYVRLDGGFLLEFSIKGRELLYVGKKEIPSSLDSEVEPSLELIPSNNKPPSFNGGLFSENMAIDENGCVHGLLKVYAEQASQNSAKSTSELGFFHKSSCSDRVDTLIYPRPVLDRSQQVQLSQANIAKNGTVMLVFKIEVLPAKTQDWLYLASLPLNGKWQIEKVTEN